MDPPSMPCHPHRPIPLQDMQKRLSKSAPLVRYNQLQIDIRTKEEADVAKDEAEV